MSEEGAGVPALPAEKKADKRKNRPRWQIYLSRWQIWVAIIGAVGAIIAASISGIFGIVNLFVANWIQQPNPNKTVPQPVPTAIIATPSAARPSPATIIETTPPIANTPREAGTPAFTPNTNSSPPPAATFSETPGTVLTPAAPQVTQGFSVSDLLAKAYRILQNNPSSEKNFNSPDVAKLMADHAESLAKVIFGADKQFRDFLGDDLLGLRLFDNLKLSVAVARSRLVRFFRSRARR